MRYPVVVHKERGSDHGVAVPDLPGCFSAGRTLDEALAMAQEAIELHVEGLIEDGLPVPPPGSIAAHQRNPEYAGGVWAVVTIDPAHLRLRARRLNITLPERTLEAVDRYAADHHLTRSGLLREAAAEYIAARRSPTRAPRHGRKASAHPPRRAVT